MDRFPSLRWPQLRRILTRAPLNYTALHPTDRRTGGSHQKFVADGRPMLILGFHDKAEIPGRTVRKILVQDIGLSEDEARRLVG